MKEQTVSELAAEMKAAVEEIRKRRPDATWVCVDYSTRWNSTQGTMCHVWIYISGDIGDSRTYIGETLALALDKVQTQAQVDSDRKAELQKQLAELEAKS